MTRRVGILTSGGDCPGLNPGIVAAAAAVRRAGGEPVGVPFGYEGLCALEGMGTKARRAHLVDLADLDASRWVREGGTLLGSRRFNVARAPRGVERALEGAAAAGLEAVVAFGGDGSLQGALALSRAGLATVGVPKTIDRDVPGTDETIGFASAVETGCELVERVMTTARSHGTAFLVEVMGRRSGELAVNVARAAGADAVVVPERPVDVGVLRERTAALAAAGGGVVVVAEGFWPQGLEVPADVADARGRVRLGDAARTLERLLGEAGAPVRSTRLGHALRGGRPCAADRLLAHSLGGAAARAALEGRGASMAAVRGGQVVLVDLDVAGLPRRKLDARALEVYADLLW